jgi:hypothetical protein
MNVFAQWLNDRRWAANARRARSWRRRLGFAERVKFDNILRPHLQEPGMVIDYPDALYHITVDDLIRAMLATRPRVALNIQQRPEPK